MTDDQINRAISESIELFASLADSPRSDEKGANCQYDQFGHLWWYSPLWAWKHSGDYDWQPRSWRTDENASAMLLERMPVGSSVNRNAGVWTVLIWQQRQYHESSHADRKTAIRSAYFAMIQKGDDYEMRN